MLDIANSIYILGSEMTVFISGNTTKTKSPFLNLKRYLKLQPQNNGLKIALPVIVSD